MKKTKSTVGITPADQEDFAPDLNEIDGEARVAELDQDILKSGDEIAGIFLRPISAGDLALMLSMGIGLLVGKMESMSFDAGAILWCQSTDLEEVRRAAVNKETFRAKVYEFLDGFEPDLFEEALPRVAELIGRMNKARSRVKGAHDGVTPSPKAGGRAG